MKDAVHTVDLGNALNLFQRHARFNLHQHAGIEVCILVVVLHAAIVVGARRHGDSANAQRRITRGSHGAQRLFNVLHKRNQQRARAHVHGTFDDDHVVPRHAEYRLGGAAAHGLQLRQQR